MNPTTIENACKQAITALATSTTPPAPRGGDGGSSGTGGQSKPPLPWGILDAKVELKHKASSWALLVSEEGDFVPLYDDDAVSMLGWLASKADWIAEHDAADSFVDEISESARTIRAPYLPRFGRKYLGEHGGGAVNVREGQTLVELADGTIERVETIRNINADMMLLETGTASEVSEIIKGFFGFDITPKQIKQTQADDKRRGNDNGLVPTTTRGREYVYKVWDVLNRIKVKEKRPNS